MIKKLFINIKNDRCNNNIGELSCDYNNKNITLINRRVLVEK